jgi:hypothetical protein
MLSATAIAISARDSFHDFNFRGARYQLCQPFTGLLKVIGLAMRL